MVDAVKEAADFSGNIRREFAALSHFTQREPHLGVKLV